MNSQKVYHCGARSATLRKRESTALRSLLDSESMSRNRCGSHRHHHQRAVIVVSAHMRVRCADDATRLFHMALRAHDSSGVPLTLPLIAIVVILLSCLCLCLTWCVCHEVARRERLIDTAAKTRRRQMSSMDELRRQTSVDRLSTLAENSVEGSNPGEVAVEVRGDSGGTLKVSPAI